MRVARESAAFKFYHIGAKTIFHLVNHDTVTHICSPNTENHVNKLKYLLLLKSITQKVTAHS